MQFYSNDATTIVQFVTERKLPGGREVWNIFWREKRVKCRLFVCQATSSSVGRAEKAPVQHKARPFFFYLAGGTLWAPTAAKSLSTFPEIRL